MARDTWFETVAIAQERAKKRLPKSAYSSLISASEKGLTVADNVAAFWHPAEAWRAGSVQRLSYRLHWTDAPSAAPIARVVATEISSAPESNGDGADSGHNQRRPSVAIAEWPPLASTACAGYKISLSTNRCLCPAPISPANT